MVHVVHTFNQPLHVVVHEDGIVLSSPKGLDVVLTPQAAEATAHELAKGAEKALSAQPKTQASARRADKARGS